MKNVKVALVILAVATLSGCVTGDGRQEQRAQGLSGYDLSGALSHAHEKHLSAPFVRSAFSSLENGDLKGAQKGINRALKFDPTNSQLHYLNGLIYHLRSSRGDSSQREYAAIGYELALQYDPSNYWAAYQLGHLNFNDQNFEKAQESFAYSLLYAPKDLTLLKALATASYHAQDLKTASEAFAKAETLSPNDPTVLRLAALTYAAGGQFGSAWDSLNRYADSNSEIRPEQVVHLSQRIDDWKQVFQRSGIQLAQTTNQVFSDDDSKEGLSVTPDSDSADSDDTDSDVDTSDSDTPTKKTPPSMAMVDVVIIRSEERNASDKGVNLLNGLTATLGGTSFTYTGTRTVNSPTVGNNTLTNVFTYAPTLSVAATYSLNIFNDNNDHNEVLARPSLIALDGKKSEFFTGAVFHVEIAGAAGSEGSVEEVPVGIKLDLTPKFIDQDTVQLDVSAARAFIEARSSNAGFNNFTQVTKTIVTANVAMKFGETIVISGLSEKETEKKRDGVPGLQDVPFVQYLFSHEDTLDFTKSVLILLTPRQPHYTQADGSPKKVTSAAKKKKKTDQPSLNELKGRPGWFRQASNLDAVFEHLQHSSFYREFRAGDVKLEHWDTEDTLAKRIKRAARYIYY